MRPRTSALGPEMKKEGGGRRSQEHPEMKRRGEEEGIERVSKCRRHREVYSKLPRTSSGRAAIKFMTWAGSGVSGAMNVMVGYLGDEAGSRACA